MMERIKLDFMIYPEELKRCYVKEPVLIKVIDPESIFLTGILGESGRKMVKRGCRFYFTKKLADRLIKMGVARKVAKRRRG